MLAIVETKKGDRLLFEDVVSISYWDGTDIDTEPFFSIELSGEERKIFKLKDVHEVYTNSATAL